MNETKTSEISQNETKKFDIQISRKPIYKLSKAEYQTSV